MDNNIFSRNLRKAIEIRGYKQVDVARATQIPKSLLNEYLSGRCKPRKEYLSRLSDFLQVSEDWLLGHNAMNSEILIDTGSVCVPIKDYDELVSASAKLKIIENMYRTNDFSSYDYDKVLEIIFGEKGENENAE